MLKPYLGPILLFFLLLTAVNIFNINSISNNFFDFTVFLNIFLFWFLINHERKEHLVLEKGMLSFAFGSVALSLLFILGFGVENMGGRVTIIGDNQNIIGIKMAASIAILIIAVAQNRLGLGKIRYLLLLPIPIMFQLLVETGSRVSFISLFVAFALGILLFKAKRVLSKFLVLAFGVTALLYGWQYVLRSEILPQRLSVAEESGLGGRDTIWQGLLPLIENNPIYGVGETGYHYFAQTILHDDVSPHNVILEVLCYTGIVGLTIYAIFLFRIFKSGYQSFRSEGLLLPLLSLIPVLGLIVSGQLLGVKFGWVIFAYIVGVSIFKPKIETLENIAAGSNR